MPAPNPIEVALTRLMPPALSETGLRSIETMLDELAATVPLSSMAVSRQWWWKLRLTLPLGIAASLAAWLALESGQPTGKLLLPVARFASVKTSGLVLISESDRIEAISDEGWVADADGAAMQAVRVRVVEANTLRDEETGIVVQVCDPREEMILTPITVF
ncbi:MAG: hypothetical protein DVB25_08125 [Verrucomicrobia bacterium]|nr:MAG: hypothetical protein DVB25_08125 [Verrucomicrobiota bacterium]